MTVLAVIGGLVGVVGLAGFLRDRVRGRRRPTPRHGDAEMRYYRDVGDSSEGGGTSI